MVDRNELAAKVKEKILIEGMSGSGKTYTCVKVAEYVALKGLDVVYIDPEKGAERELELLSDEALAHIKLDTEGGWGRFEDAVKRDDNCFLKIVDGFSEAFELSKMFLIDRFVSRGKYQIGDTEREIHDRETFILPWESYPKVYDAIRGVVHSVTIRQKPHVMCTMYGFGEKGAKAELGQDVYRKFDTVLETRQNVGQDGKLNYEAVLKKHRGRPMDAFLVLGNHVDKLKELFDRRMVTKV